MEKEESTGVKIDEKTAFPEIKKEEKMKKKAVGLTSILGVTIILTVFAMNVMAQQGAFSSDRSLIKELIVGQNEIKATLQQLNRKIDKLVEDVDKLIEDVGDLAPKTVPDDVIE